MSQIDLRACTPFGLKWDLSRAGTGIQGSEVLSPFPQAAGTAVVALPPSPHCLGWFIPPHHLPPLSSSYLPLVDALSPFSAADLPVSQCTISHQRLT